MAEILREKIGNRDGSVLLVTYQGITELEAEPDSLDVPEWADRCIQAAGTFNGASLVIEGSNNGTDWLPLSDQQGEPLIKTQPFLEQITEVPRFIRPRVTSGSGFLINIYIVLRRNSGMRT
jgi:hypothetical protein